MEKVQEEMRKCKNNDSNNTNKTISWQISVSPLAKEYYSKLQNYKTHSCNYCAKTSPLTNRPTSNESLREGYINIYV